MKFRTLLLILLIGSFKALSQNHNTIIVKFNYAYLDFENIDDKQKLRGTIGEFLNTQGVEQAGELQSKYPNILNYPVKKAFPNLTTKDTVSISRLGYEVTIPPFWAVFNVSVDTSVSIMKLMRDLNAETKLIDYAHFNYKIELASAPNDTTYYRQKSLNGAIPNADINVEQAWEIETGQPWVKVAVHDDGIDSNNIEIDVLFGGGYDGSNFPETSWGIPGVHGTAVAGIIGAKRDNVTGIAGIAGGDTTENSGVSLIDLKHDFTSNASSSDFMASVVDAARAVGSYWNYPDNFNFSQSEFFNNAPGFGVHIGNHSYVMRTDIPVMVSPGFIPDPGPVYFPDCQVCREAFLFSLQSGVINVVARANSLSLVPGEPDDYVEEMFPQSLPDNWIISVGASGYDGTTLQDGINQTQYEESIGLYSLYGANMDLIAPGSDTLVYTTASDVNANGPFEKYDRFNGTSAAAPHVSGVVALLLSHYNQPCYNRGNLSFEDVEYILEHSATNLNGAGYDDTTGWGRLNAGEALKMIEHPLYQIIHPDSLISSIVVATDTIALGYREALVGADWGPISVPWPMERNKNYEVERLLVENTYDISQYLTPQTEIIDFWARPSVSNSCERFEDSIEVIKPIAVNVMDTTLEFDIFDLTPFDTIVLFDATNTFQVKTRGYYYHFINKYEDLPTPSFATLGPEELFIDEAQDYWYPIDPTTDTARLYFSMYIRDSSLMQLYTFTCDSANQLYDSIIYNILDVHEEINWNEISVHPNPFNEYVDIAFNGITGVKDIYVLDVSGRLISETRSSDSEVQLNLRFLPKGIYFVNCVIGMESKTIKIVKS